MQLVTRADEVANMVVPEANRALCDARIGELRKGMTPEDEYFFGSFDKRDGRSSPRHFFVAGLMS
jgi:hypothetical protein